ncbi:MAG: hypothetical protein ABJI69_06245 [Balneola sp.]
MSDQIFWPEDILERGDSKPPRKILLKQAEALESLTEYNLRGEVQTNRGIMGDSDEEVFVHHFRIIATGLDNYRVTLFRVIHGFKHYPLKIYEVFTETTHDDLKNEKEFTDQLKKTLSSDEVVQLIQSLVAHSDEDIF